MSSGPAAASCPRSRPFAGSFRQEKSSREWRAGGQCRGKTSPKYAARRSGQQAFIFSEPKPLYVSIAQSQEPR